jgi:uncharacterized integral membrane protein
MNFRITISIIITLALTVTIMQNQEESEFIILFVPVTLSKLVMLTAVSIGSFILGILVSRPRKRQLVTSDEDSPAPDGYTDRRPNTLSDEDRDYIS